MRWGGYLARPSLDKVAASVVYVSLPPLPHAPGPEQYYQFLAWLQRHELHAEVGVGSSRRRGGGQGARDSSGAAAKWASDSGRFTNGFHAVAPAGHPPKA
jgi:hypothetical protein